MHAKLGKAQVADTILDRIIDDSSHIMVDGEMSMRERHGLVESYDSCRSREPYSYVFFYRFLPEEVMEQIVELLLPLCLEVDEEEDFYQEDLVR